MIIYNLKFKIFKDKRGFTVIESIIAILIISAVIGGVSSAVSTSIRGLSIAKEEVKAFYLAQEAIEMIRNQRDNNKLYNLVNGTSINWLAGIADSTDDPCYGDYICAVDASNFTIVHGDAGCSDTWGSCQNLRQDQVLGSPTYLLYGYNGAWTDTGFKREIKVEKIGTTEAAVTVSVSWMHGALPREFKTKTVLEDWF